jgi:hypothetical protein
MNGLPITSEDPAEHWGDLSVRGGRVLDLGCAYNDDECRERGWSTPAYWHAAGAALVVGVDLNGSDIARIQRETPGHYYDEPVTAEFVSRFMGVMTHIKSDCEGAEAELFRVSLTRNVRVVSIECHSQTLAEWCRAWIAEGGLTITSERPLSHHPEIVVITASRPRIPCAISAIRPADARECLAQALCLASLERCGVVPVVAPAVPRPKFGDMLRAARSQADDWFAWINSDCQLLLPLENTDLDSFDVLGMRRVEIGSGNICVGVDGYLVRASFWDDMLSQDVPDMWIGATHIDWWLTNAAKKHGRYGEAVCLAHFSHDRSAASEGTDEFGLHNIAAYEAWAARHGMTTE